MPVTLDNCTFDSFGCLPDDGPYDPIANLEQLNRAIFETSRASQPLYGLAKTYVIRQNAATFINLLTNTHVVCLPGCRIVRYSDFNSVQNGVVSGGRGLQPITNARWIGGEFEGRGAPPWGGGSSSPSPYPPGGVFRIAGHDILLEDVVIDGYGGTGNPAAGGIAMALWGDRIRVRNPIIRNPYPQDAAGIRVFGGTNFRCYGGSVDFGGDAALN